MNDPIFEIGSGHLAYVFRHSRLIHQDGSLTLNVLLNHGQAGRKIRHMYNECHDRMKEIDTDCIAMNVKSRIPAIKNLLPLAHICCNSNKSRVQVGFLNKLNMSQVSWRIPQAGSSQPCLTRQ